MDISLSCINFFFQQRTEKKDAKKEEQKAPFVGTIRIGVPPQQPQPQIQPAPMSLPPPMSLRPQVQVCSYLNLWFIINLWFRVCRLSVLIPYVLILR